MDGHQTGTEAFGTAEQMMNISPAVVAAAVAVALRIDRYLALILPQ